MRPKTMESSGSLSLLAASLVFAACATPDGAGSPTTTVSDISTGTPPPATSTLPTTTTTAAFISAGDLDVIVPPDENGEYPADLMVTCPNGPAFPIGAIYDIVTIPPDDPEGMLAAIEPFLSSGEGQHWPQEGWQLLYETEEHATIVAPTPDGTLAYMRLAREDDAWRWGGSSISGSICELQYAIPMGLNTVGWRLDPSKPEPEPDTVELHLLLTERECVDGREIGDRLIGPQVVMTDTEVRLAFAAEPPPGDAHTCPSNPETPFTLMLPVPLGDREIVADMSIGIRLEDYVS